MKKYFLLAGSSLRKAKGQMIAIIVLILLASAMLNIWLMLAMDYRQNFDRCHDSLNAEHVSLLIDKAPGEISPCLERLLNSHSQITDYRIDTALGMTGSFAYHDGEMNANFVIMEKDAALARSIGRVEMVEEGTAAASIFPCSIKQRISRWEILLPSPSAISPWTIRYADFLTAS